MTYGFLWHLVGLMLVGGFLFLRCQNCRTYLPGGPERLSNLRISSTDLWMGIWIALILILLLPSANIQLLGKVAPDLDDQWIKWLSGTIMQFSLAGALVILFRSSLSHTEVFKPISPDLKRVLPATAFMWFVLTLLLTTVSNLLWKIYLEWKGVETGYQSALLESINADHPLMIMLILVNLVVLAPIWEELLFRGLLLRFLHGRYSFWFAAIISGLLFSLMHMFISGFVGLWVFGIMLALAYRITGDIRVPILIHSIQNLNTLIAARMLPSLIQETEPEMTYHSVLSITEKIICL